MVWVARPGGRVWLIETDADSTADSAADFVRLWRHLPGPLRPLARLDFSRFIAGQGLRAGLPARLLEDAGLVDVRVQPAPGQPLLLAVGTRA